MDGPANAAVEGDGGAAVVRLDHAPGVARVNPQVVVVAVRHRRLPERAAAVGGHVEEAVHYPHRFRVLRVSEHVGVVPGAAPAVGVVDQLPAIAAVVRAVQPALCGLHDSPDPARLGRRDRDANPPLQALRKAGVAGQRRPGVAAVRGLVQPAVGASARNRPGVAEHLPHGGVQDAGVGGVHRQVYGARLVAHEQHTLPGVAAVAGAEDAPLAVGRPGVAQRRHVHEVRVAGVNAHTRYVPAVGQPNVPPRLAPVRGLVHAVARGDVVPDAGLAHSGVDDVGVRVGDGDSPHGGGLEEAVRDVLPVGAAVVGLPDAPVARPEVEGHGVVGVAGGGNGATAPVGSYAAPLHRLEHALVYRSHWSNSSLLCRFEACGEGVPCLGRPGDSGAVASTKACHSTGCRRRSAPNRRPHGWG